MAISPVAGAIYANQVAPALSSMQSDQQAKFDMQNALAASAANDEKKRIEEVRPTEETYKIDPQNQHEKGANSGKNEESSENENSQEQEQEFSGDEQEFRLNIIV